ncbi:ankyrin repeat domain-containing protein [Paraburkholderia sp. CNPSo 3076]|uniref:ankyrin repeat domain-containing protein n=1 Tax=Paraburkholderia sp. CNPSo 3076 TaxID=2940936 RepID=UPI00225611DA|nr:ankyrin repeat domain-containing protein [Paraburkholderia sp. CNPSo 3076]MCX5545671.1 ankyrin repeat domain-containing protein [Paraburkholderia sp. CNPSo 3076]
MALLIDAAARRNGNGQSLPHADEGRQTRARSSVARWLSAHDFPDAHSCSVDGITPLMLAAMHGEYRIVAALLDEGAPVRALDDNGNDALWYACLYGTPEPILLLVSAGLNVDHANAHDVTCLMQAAASGRVDVMWLLISLGASDSLVAPDGRTAFDMATDFGLQLLLTVDRLKNAMRESSRFADDAPSHNLAH